MEEEMISRNTAWRPRLGNSPSPSVAIRSRTARSLAGAYAARPFLCLISPILRASQARLSSRRTISSSTESMPSRKVCISSGASGSWVVFSLEASGGNMGVRPSVGAGFRVGGAWPRVRVGHTPPGKIAATHRTRDSYWPQSTRGERRLSKAPDAKQQEHDHHGGQREPVVGEDEQAVPGEVVEKKPYGQIPDDPRGDGADQEEQRAVGVDPRPEGVGQAQERGGGRDRDAHQKRKPRRLLPPEAQKEAERDRRPRARDTGEHGRRLGQADTERLLEAQLVGGACLPTHHLTHYEERANQHQVERDEPRRAYLLLEEVLEQESDDARRDAGNQDQIRHSLVPVLEIRTPQRAHEGHRHAQEVPPEKRDDGQHGTRVDRRVERRPEAVLIHAEKVLPEQQVP